MYIYLYACMYKCMYKCMYVHTSIRMCVYINVCTYDLMLTVSTLHCNQIFKNESNKND